MVGIIKKRILGMDVIRAVSIIAVITLHASATVLYRCMPYSTTYNISFIINQLSRFCVPAFIVISGMGLTVNYKEGGSYSEFIMKRFFRVVPQYIVWCIIYILLITKNFNIQEDINDIIYGNVFYHFYYVPLIIEFYIIFPFIYRFMGKRWWVFFSFIITVLLLAYTYYFKSVSPEEWFWNKKNLLYWLFYFSMGGYIGKNIDRISEKLNSHRLFVSVLFLISAFIVIYGFISGNQFVKNVDYVTTFQRPAVLVYSTFFIFFIFSFNFSRGFIMNIIRYISDISYDIYLVQSGILYLYTQYYMSRYIHADNLSFEINAFLITIFGSIVISKVKKVL
ncbi:Putative poly-beta-1,6-N-acetyl-D-glucosamine export protein [Clostridiaceae bacterium BL-3]|nr:Putative poly-beta-1,6-N-acetyl-D-glucosamine export protein [Clostridiaceae bacterium BL-3]